MIIINKLIVFCDNKNKDVISGIKNLVLNNGNVDFNIITKIPEDIKNFKLTYEFRFNNIINEIISLNKNDDYEDEKSEILKDCSGFLKDEEICWINEAVSLIEKNGAYSPIQYFKNNTGVKNNPLTWDSLLPKNSEKQYSFYTEDNPPLEWVKNLSSIFVDVRFEIHYKEKSQLKYKKVAFLAGGKVL